MSDVAIVMLKFFFTFFLREPHCVDLFCWLKKLRRYSIFVNKKFLDYRLPSPSNSLDDSIPQARLYIANTSRQNLETIVEAIRHLEGDHLFSDEPAQDMPLALTNKQQTMMNSTSTKSTTSSSPPSSSSPSATSATVTSAKQRILHAEHFLQFHTQQQTQQRPGVIVVKHSWSSNALRSVHWTMYSKRRCVRPHRSTSPRFITRKWGILFGWFERKIASVRWGR